MKIKLQSQQDKKGYIQIDFSIAVFIFITLSLLMYLVYNSYLESNLEIRDINELNFNSKDLCYILISNPGVPNNWYQNINSSSLIGFRNSNNLSLNSTSISSLSNSIYFDLLNKINLIDSFLFVSIDGIESNNNYLSYGVKSSSVGSLVSSYNCFSNYQNEVVKVYVEIWK